MQHVCAVDSCQCHITFLLLLSCFVVHNWFVMIIVMSKSGCLSVVSYFFEYLFLSIVNVQLS